MEKNKKVLDPITKEKSREDIFLDHYLNKSRKIASRYFQELDSLPGAPEEYEYFVNILKKVFIENQLISYKGNEKFVASFCTMIPPEIIRAAGARPIMMCSSSYIGSSAFTDGIPSSFCPHIKAISENAKIGLNNNINNCDMFIVPLSCDCKKILAEELSSIKPTIKLNIPFNRFNDDGMDFYVKELKNIATQISNLTGKQITRESLAKEIKLYSEVQKEIEIFNELKANVNPLIRGTHATIVMNALAYDDLSNWSIHLKKLNEQLISNKEKERYLTKKKMPRILLLGSSLSFPNIKVPLIIEQEGGIIVSNQTCLSDKSYDNYASISHDSLDGYFRGLANRSVRPCVCSVFPNSEVTINKTKEIIREKQIDGIIYLSYQGCITSSVEYEILTRSLKNEDVPILKVETDLYAEDIELLKVRIGAFIEMLNFKK